MSIAILASFIFGAFLPSTLALPSGLGISIRQAAQVASDANGLPANWTFLGCFTDSNPASRTLQEASFTNSAMTPLLCTQFCSETNGTPPYNFAATEYSQECYCDFNIQGSAQKLDDSSCTFPCGGDTNQTCGGASKVSLYQNMNDGLLPIANNKPTVAGGWSFLGCFSDALNGNPRTLDVRLDIPAGVTAESCTARCTSAGFTTAGLEFAQECWCGNAFDTTTRDRPDACSMTCKADHTELCGAANFLSIYTLGVSMASSSTTTLTTAVTSTVKPTTTAAPTTTISPTTTLAPTTTVKPTTTTANPTVATTKPTTTSAPQTGTTVMTTASTATIPIVIPTIIPTVVPTIVTSIIPIPTTTFTTTFSEHNGGLPCVTCIGF